MTRYCCIDIIAMSNNEILFCECTWSKNVGTNIISNLIEKSKNVDYSRANTKEYFMIVARYFNTHARRMAEQNNIKLSEVQGHFQDRMINS